jgi:hypothetical protein
LGVKRAAYLCSQTEADPRWHAELAEVLRKFRSAWRQLSIPAVGSWLGLIVRYGSLDSRFRAQVRNTRLVGPGEAKGKAIDSSQ